MKKSLPAPQTSPDLRGLSLLVVAVAWSIGILLDSWLNIPAFASLIGAATALLCLLLLWRDPYVRLLMLVLLWLLLGAWRYSTVSPIGDPQAISSFIGSSKLVVRGSVSAEPKLEGRTRVLPIAVSSISLDKGNSWQAAHGQLEVQTLDSSLESVYGANYGDSVELQGKLQGPTPASPPGVFASMAFPRVTINGSGGNPLIAALDHLRVFLANIIQRSLPQPKAALLIAILLGLRTPALKTLTTIFNETGTVHFIAPSGFKVTILAGLVTASTRRLSEKPGTQQQHLLPAQKQQLNRRRWLSTSLVIVSIIIYTLLNGAGPAALRAGIMGILLVVAPRFGRVYNIYTSLAFAALLMSMLDPFVIWDVGFQLSFLGTLGIVLLTPLFHRPLHALGCQHLPFGHTISKNIAVTLAAQTATLPISAITYHQISLVAPLTNVLTVPLLGPLILVGFLVCGSGLLYAPLGLITGWLAWPLLHYIITIVSRTALIPYAYLNGITITNSLVWAYYALLSLLVGSIMYRWPTTRPSSHARNVKSRIAPGTLRLLQLSAALLTILATGGASLAVRSADQLTITFLNVGPANQPAQGEAILIHTPTGKYILIDGGPDATFLAQELDSRLPSWQRTLDVVLLTSPRSDALNGLLDVVNRYQVGEVLDGGMLHPNTRYALWRHTVAERHIPYIQVRQGSTIPLGTQLALQVLWPPSPLHTGSQAELDNSLVARLVAPGRSMLLLGASALSSYALRGVLDTVAPQYLQADVVQVVAEAGKSFPAELSAVLQAAHPEALVVTPTQLTAKQRKAGTIPAAVLPQGIWQIYETAVVGTIEISSSGARWVVNPST